MWLKIYKCLAFIVPVVIEDISAAFTMQAVNVAEIDQVLACYDPELEIYGCRLSKESSTPIHEMFL